MELKKIMLDAIVGDEITSGHGKLKVNHLQQVGDFEVFNYLNSDGKEVKIGDNIDYLDLFMRIAEQAYLKSKDNFSSHIVASNIGGKNIFLGRLTREDREKFQYGYIYLKHSLAKNFNRDIETKIGFWAELNLMNSNDESFEKEYPKVLKVLNDENKKAWSDIMEKRLNFLKTDMYVLDLPKLHSWGFQTINAKGDSESDFNYVRSKAPKPRGMERRKNKSK